MSCCQSLLQPLDPSFQSLHPPASSTRGPPPVSATPPRHATQGPAPPPTTSASDPPLPRIARPQPRGVSAAGLLKRHSARELLGVSHASSIDTRESFCLGAAARRWTAGSGLVALARHDGANASRAHCGAIIATVSFSDRRPSRMSASCSPGDCSRAGRGSTEDGASARRSHTIADGRESQPHIADGRELCGAASSPMHIATTSSSTVARSFCIPSQAAESEQSHCDDDVAFRTVEILRDSGFQTLEYTLVHFDSLFWSTRSCGPKTSERDRFHIVSIILMITNNVSWTGKGQFAPFPTS